MSATIDYYRLLGVDPMANADTINRAYKASAKRVHPDVNHSPLAHHQMLELTEARRVLQDPILRAMHDRRLDDAERRFAAPPMAQPAPREATPTAPPNYTAATAVTDAGASDWSTGFRSAARGMTACAGAVVPFSSSSSVVSVTAIALVVTLLGLAFQTGFFSRGTSVQRRRCITVLAIGSPICALGLFIVSLIALVCACAAAICWLLLR